MACSSIAASRVFATNNCTKLEDGRSERSVFPFILIYYNANAHGSPRVSFFSLSRLGRRRLRGSGFLLTKYGAVCTNNKGCHCSGLQNSHKSKTRKYIALVHSQFGDANQIRKYSLHTTVIGCHNPRVPWQSTILDTPMLHASDDGILFHGMAEDSLADRTREKPFLLQDATIPSAKPLCVAVDVDEVLGSFLATLNKFIAEKYFLHHKLSEYHVYNFMKIWNCSQAEANERVHAFFESEHFKDGISPIPGSHQALIQLAKFCNLIVVTSRQHVIRKPTIDWLERHYPGIFGEVHFGNHFALHGSARPKSEICRSQGVDILIDDNPRYAVDCAEHGIEVLLFDFRESYPWSRTPDGPSHPLITRVRDWKEVEHALHSRSVLRSS